jgi:hypothetical protein
LVCYRPGIRTRIPPSDLDGIIAERRRGVKCKVIAARYGVHPSTVSRAITDRLIELDQYRPQEFLEQQRERRAEAWKHYRNVWDERDARHREEREAAAEYQARLEGAEREERRMRVRAFREAQKERILGGQGLPTR